MRKGFALLSVVMILAGGAAIALASLALMRSAIRSTQNRIALTRSAWQAEDCAARAIALIDVAAAGTDEPGRARKAMAPDSIEALLAQSALVIDCPGIVTFGPAGMKLPVNVAGAGELRAILRKAGLSASGADSLAVAMLDWRDVDDVVRADGCERECYAQARGTPPRNGAFVHIDELNEVRGFAAADSSLLARAGLSLRELFTVEDDRVSVRHASPVLLTALPGIGPRGAEAIARRRRLGGWNPASLQEIGALLPAADASELTTAMAALERVATIEPSAWLLHVESPRPAPGDARAANATVLDLRLRVTSEGVQLVRRSVGP